MIYFILSLSIAALGAVSAKKLGLPAYAMIGSLISIGIYNTITEAAYIPIESKVIIQIVAGTLIGCRTKKEDMLALKTILVPIAVNTVVIIIYGLSMGFLVYAITDYSLVTSIFSTAPGGIVEMTLTGLDLNADIAVVSTLQLVRYLSILGFFPVLIGLFLKRLNLPKPMKEEALTSSKVEGNVIFSSGYLEDEIQISDYEGEVVLSNQVQRKNILFTVIIGGAFGLVGYLLDFPAGPLIMSMIGASLQNIIFSNAYLPMKVKTAAQLCAGILIGQTITITALVSLSQAIIPAMILLVGYMLVTVFLALILYKTGELDFPTALFACAPGGASDLVLICEEFGANSTKVSLIQFVRIIAVIGLYPFIVGKML